MTTQAQAAQYINPLKVQASKQQLAQELLKEQEPLPQEKIIRFEVVRGKDGQVKLLTLPNTTQVDFTTVTLYQDEVEAPHKLLTLFGYRINLMDKVKAFRESYIKNYALSKSHNLLVAKFAEFKVAFLGTTLSLLGVSSEEIQGLQKKAIQGAMHQNKILFEENEYNGELIAITGGSKKQTKAQQSIINEIRTQLITQMSRLGRPDYYNQIRMVELQLRQCKRILLRLIEEKMNLEYKLAYLELFGEN